MTARKKGEDKYFVLYLCSTIIVLPPLCKIYKKIKKFLFLFQTVRMIERLKKV